MTHSFYIPVMGTGFTIKTPLAVAKYGIDSVLSLVDDVLIEQMRKYLCTCSKEPYSAITSQDTDARAHRITAYLNLLDKLINQQVQELKTTPFECGSEITRYYDLLPETSPLKQRYCEMMVTKDDAQKKYLQSLLRESIVPGHIDVNIMVKLDRDHYLQGQKRENKYSDALSALRGYAQSTLSSSLILSAGFNANLYHYMTEFEDFYPTAEGSLKKQITLKVSDYRSAMIQGKYLAKKGLWVSEYRVESALNCGGHAFVNDGQLMGVILEEFKQKREEFLGKLYTIYCDALKSKKRIIPEQVCPTRITAQGGIGTHEEHQFLLDQYHLDAIGWGTPFLLVPEVTDLDETHLNALVSATDKDVYLSYSSPLGVPFWNLKTSASEASRCTRIQLGRPGSLCPKQYSMCNEKFTGTPLCRGSREYQKQEIAKLQDNKTLTPEQLHAHLDDILCKSCICHDLAGGVTLKYGIDSNATTAICPGPNIINFAKIIRLEEMLAHIYGKISLLVDRTRPHMFLKELMIHIDFLKDETRRSFLGLLTRSQQKMQETKENLLKGIDYYQQLAKDFAEEKHQHFLTELADLREELEKISFTSLSTST